MFSRLFREKHFRSSAVHVSCSTNNAFIEKQKKREEKPRSGRYSNSASFSEKTVETRITSSRGVQRGTIRGGSELADAERTCQDAGRGKREKEGRESFQKRSAQHTHISGIVGSLNGARCNEIALYRIIRCRLRGGREGGERRQSRISFQ